MRAGSKRGINGNDKSAGMLLFYFVQGFLEIDGMDGGFESAVDSKSPQLAP